MRKRIASVLLAAALLFPTALSVRAEEVSWFSLLETYMNAEKAGNEEKMIEVCLDVMDFYGEAEDLDACINAYPFASRAARYYEERGDYDTARRCYEYYRYCLSYIDAHSEENFYDAIQGVDALLAHYSFMDPIVVAASENPVDTPYYGAPGEPLSGTYVGTCDTFDEDSANAYLLYAHFGREELADFAWLLPKTDEPYLLEIAWNIPGETFAELREITSGKHDAYLRRNLEYLASLENVDVLIRFAAEVNNWNDLPQSYADAQKNMAKRAQDFIDAFRHVAKQQDKYAPDAAMVFSPNDISNWYADMEDFYPGDKYVDWVGVSTYMNRSYAASGKVGNTNDAYYCYGLYDNQFVKMRHVVEAFGDRKPILVSECGFLYKSADKKQTEAYAATKLREFYENIGIVYPQVKAILYFNTNLGGDCYALSGSQKVRDAYEDALENNRAIDALLDGESGGYIALDRMAEKADTLSLFTYVYFPGNPETSVSYYLDGKFHGTAKRLPYQIELDMEQIKPGEHTLTVVASAGKTERRQEIPFTVSEDGFIGDAMAHVTDVKEDDSAYAAIESCLARGYMTAPGGKFRPDETLTRAELIRILADVADVDPEDYEGKATSCKDIDPEDALAPFAAWASKAGISFDSGSTASRPWGNSSFYSSQRKFEPEKLVTEAELGRILPQLAKACGTASVTTEKKLNSTNPLTRRALAAALAGMF